MKRMSRICCTLALLLMSLGAVTSANAALAGFSPNPFRLNGVITGGMPAWFQGQDGVAVQPCMNPALCGLIGAPDFNPALPLSYPTNFPSEAFYFNATAIFPVGASSALVVMAVEYVFLNPITRAFTSPAATPTALAQPFQRLRLVHTIPGGGGVLTPAQLAGNFTVTTPWGVTIFPAADANVKCVNQGGDTKCSMTQDLASVPPNFAPVLGTGVPGSISSFLRDPAAPLGFLGNGAAAASFLGGAPNSITVSDPLGATGTTTNLVTLIGQTVGMEVQPGVNHNFGAVLMTPPPVPPVVPFVPVPKTITVTNTTGFPVTFADLNAPAVKTGADALDFLVAPPTQPAAPAPALVPCAAGTVLANSQPAVGAVPAVPAGVCGFDITFTPVAAAKAARVANILLAPTAAIAANNPPPVTLNLSGTAQVTVITTVTTPHGTITPDATVDPLTGAAPAGSPVTFTVTPHTKKFKVKSLDDVVGAFAPAPITAPFTINTGATNHLVTATFMQSGDLDASGTLDVADALKALKIVAGVQGADADDLNNSAVKVAPLSTDITGKLVPAALNANPTANPGIGDVLVILRRALNLDVW